MEIVSAVIGLTAIGISVALLLTSKALTLPSTLTLNGPVGEGMVVRTPVQYISFWKSFETNTWEPKLMQVLERFLKPGSLLLDVGAWVGPVTLFAAKRCQARVLAIEPDPVALGFLRENLQLSLVPPGQVSVVTEALSNQDGTTSFGGNGGGVTANIPTPASAPGGGGSANGTVGLAGARGEVRVYVFRSITSNTA